MGDGRGPAGPRPWLPVAAVVALLGAAMLASRYANPVIATRPPGVGDLDEAPQGPARDLPSVASSATPPPLGASIQLPPWFGTVTTVLCVTLVVVTVVALVWIFLRDRLAERTAPLPRESTPPTPAEIRQQVRAAVDAGLEDLADDDGDPRRAVIACWVRLEEAAAAAGTPREPGDTSTDLVRRLLAAHLVDGSVLGGFAEVYRIARFATHAVDEDMRTRARSALYRLRDDLAVGAR
jgi:hypothetical protein